VITILRDNLDMTAKEVSDSGVLNVIGAIVSRVAIGFVVDIVGPRYSVAGVLLAIAPAVYCSSLVINPGGLMAVRFFLGVGLCVFVCNQFWWVIESMWTASSCGPCHFLVKLQGWLSVLTKGDWSLDAPSAGVAQCSALTLWAQ
jgi:hypothetical protein